MSRPSSMGRRAVVSWDEQDVYTRWRRLYTFASRPGAVKAIKRTTHKRERREARAEIRTERTTDQ